MKRTEVLEQAIRCYGEAAQTDVCVEECSELIKALMKYRRKPCETTRTDIIEELADVQIVVEQMRMLYGATQEAEDKKLARLEKRLAEEFGL